MEEEQKQVSHNFEQRGRSIKSQEYDMQGEQVDIIRRSLSQEQQELDENTMKIFRKPIYPFLDTINEGVRTIVRESFRQYYSRIDSLTATLLHLLQSPLLANYYHKRRERLKKNLLSQRYCSKCQKDLQISNKNQQKLRDQFTQIYYDKEFFENKQMGIKRMASVKSLPLFHEYESDQAKVLNIVEHQLSKSKDIRSSLNPFKIFGLFAKSGWSVIEFMKLIFPSTLKKERSREQRFKTDDEYQYMNLVDFMMIKRKGDFAKIMDPPECEGCQIKKRIVEVVLTPDDYTTGLIEDLEMSILIAVENFFATLEFMIKGTAKIGQGLGKIKLSQIPIQSLARKIVKLCFMIYFPMMYIRQYTNLIKYSLSLPAKVINRRMVQRIRNVLEYNRGELRKAIEFKVDRRTMETIIKSMGYPYENYKATTLDGIILNIERIPQHLSKRIVILCHGIFDTPFTWVANGASDSIGCRAWDIGYDVFIATFRGVLPRDHVPEIEKDYWNYSLNELAEYDIDATIQQIIAIKKSESQNPEEFSPDELQINYIGHSLGGAVFHMYIINKIRENQPHHLYKGIMLSPAGVLMNTSPFIYFLTKFFGEYVKKITSKVALPQSIIDLLTKIFQDLKNIPATTDLLSFVGSKLLGGNYHSVNSPLSVSARLYYNAISYVRMDSSFLKGISLKLIHHFYQLCKSETFQAYDYGEEMNMEIYGTPTAFNYLENFHLIDCEVYYIISLSDSLIKPEGILKMYRALEKAHPKLANLRIYEGFGHAEFTYLTHPIMIETILEILQ